MAHFIVDKMSRMLALCLSMYNCLSNLCISNHGQRTCVGSNKSRAGSQGHSISTFKSVGTICCVLGHPGWWAYLSKGRINKALV